VQRVQLLEKAIADSAGFIMSGSICGWGDVFIPQLDLAVFVYTPTDIRLQRLQAREFKLFGERILENGDMHESFCWFIDYAGTYDTGNPPDRCLKLHEQWIASLPCPVARTDGIMPVEESIMQITNILKRGYYEPKQTIPPKAKVPKTGGNNQRNALWR